MRLSTQIKPISYVKASAAQIIDELADGGEPIVVTQNGEAKAVVMSVFGYEQTQETFALLKMLTLARDDREAGRTIPYREAIESVRASLKPA